MSLIQRILNRTITSLSANELNGITGIRPFCFYGCPLTNVELSESVKYIEGGAFNSCKSLAKIIFGKNVEYVGYMCFADCELLTTIDTENMNPYCMFYDICGIDNTAWYINQPEGSMITMAKSRILFSNKITTPSNGFKIPDTVINLASYSCCKYGDTVDSNFTSVVIPDTIEMVQRSIFSGQTALTQITVGSNVNRFTGTLTPGTNIKNLIFRQPAGMVIELPEAGEEGYGLGYNKDSYSINIYTDNEYIKNYDWAADNVTATFYPLSEAPA